MTYSTPKILTEYSASALVQQQWITSKIGEFMDRLDLQILWPTNAIADPSAYEADE